MQILNAKNLTKLYGGRGDASSTRALNNISLALERGEFVGIMGPSGSGKTTLLHILSGISRPSSGSVEIDGQDMTAMNSSELALFRRQKLGFVFQEFNLLDSLTLRENVMLPMILDNRCPEEMEIRAKDIMTQFEIYEFAHKYPGSVSGGQQQRTAVSRALANDPVLVFADEPTGNLDSRASTQLMRCFETMHAERGCTLLMVTHDPFAASYCQRVLFIKDGALHMEIVRKDRRQEFFDRILDCLAVLGGEHDL